MINPVVNFVTIPRLNVSSYQKRCLILKPKSIFSSKEEKQSPPFTHIVQIGDPVLRLKCDPIHPDDIASSEVQNIIKTMKFVLQRFDGIGISAPQVGVPAQIMMLQFTKKQLEFWSEEHRKTREMEIIPLKIFINPKLLVVDKAQVGFA